MPPKKNCSDIKNAGERQLCEEKQKKALPSSNASFSGFMQGVEADRTLVPGTPEYRKHHGLDQYGHAIKGPSIYDTIVPQPKGGKKSKKIKRNRRKRSKKTNRKSRHVN